MIREKLYTEKQRREHKGGVAELGCLYCLLYRSIHDVPAQVHHCDTGIHRRKDDMRTVGLCPEDHGGKESFIYTKLRRQIENELLAYVAEHSRCTHCKQLRGENNGI